MSLKFTRKLYDKVLAWLLAEMEPPREFPLSDFERIQYEIRPCDVLLIEGRTRVSRVIKMITQSSWSHAAIYIGRTYDIANPAIREKIHAHYKGNPDDQLLIESVINQGVIVSPITKYKNDHIRICRPKGLNYRDAQSVIAYAIERLGIKYDIRQILDLARFLFPWGILPRRWRSSLFEHKAGSATKLSCSLLLAQAFASVRFPILPLIRQHKEVGVEMIERNPRLFTPSDFDYSPFFDIIKYPIFELSEMGTYQNLPWNKEGLTSDTKGHIELQPSKTQSPRHTDTD